MGATAIQSINEVINENTALKERNERLDNELRELQQSTKEMKERLKKLAKFESLLANTPPVWVIELTNKTLIASIHGRGIALKGRGGNYVEARTDELKEKAKGFIDDMIESALIDVFMNPARFNEMAKRQKLYGEDQDGN